MSKIYYLFKSSFEKSFKDLIRYKFNTISDILSYYALFIALFYGFKIFGSSITGAPVNMGDTIGGFLSGYFVWMIMSMAYSDIAYSVVNDASRGTLEQLSMSSIGLSNIMIVRSITNLIVNLLIALLVLKSIIYTIGYNLNMNLPAMFVVIVFGIFSMFGVGMIFGGLAMIFKKVQSMLNIVQYFLIGILLPGSEFGGMLEIFAPFRLAFDMIYGITVKGMNLSQFSEVYYLVIILNSTVYFVIGLIVFNRCTGVAKKKGLLGQY